MKGAMIGVVFGALVALIVQPLVFPNGFIVTLMQLVNVILGR